MWLPCLPPGGIQLLIHYVKSMGSENEKTRPSQTERFLDGTRSLKPPKPSPKSFAFTEELKKQFTYTLKPSKDSSTDIRKSKGGNGEERTRNHADKSRQKEKYFADMNIENIFVNSEYFKLKNGNPTSVSFCSGENMENRWTIDKCPDLLKKPEEPTKKTASTKKSEAQAEEDDMKYLKGVLSEVKQLNQDFGSLKTNLQTIEKLLYLPKQVSLFELEEWYSRKRTEEIQDDTVVIFQDFLDNYRALDVPECPDLDKIISNLHVLSEKAYQLRITQTSRGAKFGVPREIPISLYADGMLLRNSDFRKYTELKAGLFLRDIEDGFYPTELRSEYPNGVPFQVTDKRSQSYEDRYLEPEDKFPGDGQRLGSVFDGKPPSMVYLKTEVWNGTCEADKKRMSELLTRVKRGMAGDLPPVCSQIINPLQSYKNPSSDACRHCRCTDDSRSGDPAPKSMTIKVRNGMGNEDVFRVSMSRDDKMNRFQRILFKELCERYHNDYVGNGDSGCDGSVPEFEIHVYGRKPFRLSENLNLYPSECGIVDNSVINITEI